MLFSSFRVNLNNGKMDNQQPQHRSILVDGLSDMVEFANRHFTLSKYLVRGDKDVFFRIEKMNLWMMAICLCVLYTLQYLPRWLAIVLAILLVQRVFEFVIVYSRNFIFGRGRVFTDFRDPQKQGEWLIMMFSLNVAQIIVIYSIWYRLLSLIDSAAFMKELSVLDSVYFTIVTFLTVGYGDILPISVFARILVLSQCVLTFYTLVIVVNGLISIHFRKK